MNNYLGAFVITLKQISRMLERCIYIQYLLPCTSLTCLWLNTLEQHRGFGVFQKKEKEMGFYVCFDILLCS